LGQLLPQCSQPKVELGRQGIPGPWIMSCPRVFQLCNWPTCPRSRLPRHRWKSLTPHPTSTAPGLVGDHDRRLMLEGLNLSWSPQNPRQLFTFLLQLSQPSSPRRRGLHQGDC
jgi:hypothetical protein